MLGRKICSSRGFTLSAYVALKSNEEYINVAELILALTGYLYTTTNTHIQIELPTIQYYTAKKLSFLPVNPREIKENNNGLYVRGDDVLTILQHIQKNQYMHRAIRMKKIFDSASGFPEQSKAAILLVKNGPESNKALRALQTEMEALECLEKDIYRQSVIICNSESKDAIECYSNLFIEDGLLLYTKSVKDLGEITRSDFKCTTIVSWIYSHIFIKTFKEQMKERIKRKTEAEKIMVEKKRSFAEQMLHRQLEDEMKVIEAKDIKKKQKSKSDKAITIEAQGKKANAQIVISAKFHGLQEILHWSEKVYYGHVAPRHRDDWLVDY